MTGRDFEQRLPMRGRWTVPLLLLALLYGYWVIADDYGWFPRPQIERSWRQALRRYRGYGFRDVQGRTAVDCAPLADSQTAVLLTLGQSNAANHGDLGYQPAGGVFNFNFFDGRCYVARDPLLGATGTGGSVWVRVADKLIRTNRYRQVVIAPIAVGGAEIERWAAGGDLYPRIAKAAHGLKAGGLTVTHVLWHQGESDSRGTSPAQYLERFGSMLSGLRAAGIAAPVYVAVATKCGSRNSEEIRAVQRQLPQRFGDVRSGPDTDQLNESRFRADDCHFSGEGLERHAQLWMESLAR